MLHSSIQPVSTTYYSLRGEQQRKRTSKGQQQDLPGEMDDVYDDDVLDGSGGGGGGGGKGRTKSRRELPTGAVATLKAWLLSPEHFTHPYPTPQDQAMLMEKTGIDKKQLKNWFTNARRRIWKPMLKKQIEQGKLVGAGAPGAPGAPGSVPGLMLPGGSQSGATPTASMENPHSVQAMRVHYQQAMQDQPPPVGAAAAQQPAPATQVDTYGNIVYSTQPDPTANVPASAQYYGSGGGEGDSSSQLPTTLATTSSIGTLAQVSSNAQLSKTDSHAVLMELFARDQDLVRQATESARLKAESKQQQQSQQQGQSAPGQQAAQQASAPTSQHPMLKAPSGAALHGVPTLNSWPHFSSINSLNNLGTLPGVKSIASLSGQDLASKGNVNKMGNLAQVKSQESMGKNDSYAFLEVFFGDRSSTGNLSGLGGGGTGSQKGGGGKGDEDNEEIGLSLEDESPQQQMVKKEFPQQAPAPAPLAPAPAMGPLPGMGRGQNDHGSSSSMDTGTLKRAYDDAMAARGLMSVSRSCEKLTDLELPAKIQRTLSQEFINKEQEQQMRQQHEQKRQQQQQQTSYSSQQQSTPDISHQYPGQQPTEPANTANGSGTRGSSQDNAVQVASSTACVMCSRTDVDTQLRPCGHMFHERCLKPSLANPIGPPKCPIDDIPIHSVVLAIPDASPAEQQQSQSGWAYSTENKTDVTQM